jgi:hypothetical protein
MLNCVAQLQRARHSFAAPRASKIMKATREKIILRSTPCRCGCLGRDPWHAASVRRVVTMTSETTGTIKMPYGQVEVARKQYTCPVTGRALFGAWVKVNL